MPITARVSVLGCALALAACGSHVAGASDVGTTALRAVSSTKVPSADWTRFGYDAQRSGVGPVDTGIRAGQLSRLKRRTVALDGTVDSSAIELAGVRVRGRTRDVIVVTTTYGRTIAIDALTGGRLWEYTPPSIHDYEGSAQVTTATPVADPDRRYVYASSPDGRIRKLAIASGGEVRSAHWPVTITRDPSKEKIAGALNLSGNYVVAVTGGYIGDAPPYQGHVAMIDRTSGRLLHVWNSLCSNEHRLIVPASCPQSDSAIWAREGAVIEPGTGRVLIATGNGDFNGRADWGDSVLELSPDAAHLLHNWTPRDQAQLQAGDTDIGSTAPGILPVTAGRRLAVQGGKDGKLRLLDLDRLDGTRGGAGPRLGGELQRITIPGGSQMLTAPAVWAHAGKTYVFVAEDGGTAAYRLDGRARPKLVLAWQNATAGTSPVLAGGLLYVYDEVDGTLEAFNPISGIKLASLPAASGHWNSPIVAGGRIVLPVGSSGDHARSGELFIYHLPGR